MPKEKERIDSSSLELGANKNLDKLLGVHFHPITPFCDPEALALEDDPISPVWDGEYALLQGEFDLETDGKRTSRTTVAITNRHYYELSLGDDSVVTKKKKSLNDIHSIAIDEKNPYVFYVNFFAGHTSVKSRAVAGLNAIRQTFRMNISFDSFLKTKKYTCSNSSLRYQWEFVLKRAISNHWQRFLEETLLAEPEIYQRHAFVMKGGSLHRMLLLSHIWIYNVEIVYHPTTIQELKWARPVASLKAITIPDDESTAELIISFDQVKANMQAGAHDLGTKQSDFNKKQVFTFQSIKERDQMILKLRALYIDNTGVELPIVGTLPKGLRVEEKKDDDDVILLMETNLIKLTGGWRGRHTRLVQLRSNGHITWKEKKDSKKIYDEYAISVNTHPNDATVLKITKDLNATDKSCMFHVVTSGKMLVFLAPDERIKDKWVTTLETLCASSMNKRNKKMYNMSTSTRDGPFGWGRTSSTNSANPSSNTLASPSHSYQPSSSSIPPPPPEDDDSYESDDDDDDDDAPPPPPPSGE